MFCRWRAFCSVPDPAWLPLLCRLHVLPHGPMWLPELQLSFLHSSQQGGRRVGGPCLSLISACSGAFSTLLPVSAAGRVELRHGAPVWEVGLLLQEAKRQEVVAGSFSVFALGIFLPQNRQGSRLHRHVPMRQFPLNFWGAGTRCVEPSHPLHTTLQGLTLCPGLVVSLDLCARAALQPCGQVVTAMIREAEET